MTYCIKPLAWSVLRNFLLISFFAHTINSRKKLQTYFWILLCFSDKGSQKFWVNIGLGIISLSLGVCGCSRKDICRFLLSCNIKLQGGQSYCHGGRVRKTGVAVDGHYAAGWNSPLVFVFISGRTIAADDSYLKDYPICRDVTSNCP